MYTSDNNFGNTCEAMHGFVYVIGSEQQIGGLKMIAIDSINGNTVWTLDNTSGFTQSTDQLFLYDGLVLSSISPIDGKLNWSTTLFGIRNSIRTYFANNFPVNHLIRL